MHLNKDYWDKRYQDKTTGWDVGEVTAPLKEYIDQLQDKTLKILIPGCGHGYEAEYLFKNGFINVYLADISELPLLQFKERCPGFPDQQLLKVDFFELDMKFDLILEQTFFCAFDPSLRPAYAKKTFQLLKPGGKLTGVLFDQVPDEKSGPPFGGIKEEYISYFRPYYTFKYFEPCYNSIAPRAGRELFICLIKKDI